MSLRELAEELDVEASSRHFGDAGVSDGADVGRTPAGLERCALTNDGARADVTDGAAVHPYLELAVEHERHGGRSLVLAEQEVARVQLNDHRRGVATHDAVGQRPLERRLGLGDVGRLVFATPRRVAAEDSPGPDLVTRQG